jgi:hypothetical protein
LLRFALCPKIGSILEKAPWAEGSMHIVQKLDEIYCRHKLGPFDL